MIFVLTETWPLVSSAGVMKQAEKLAGTRDLDIMKPRGPYFVMGGDGVKTYTVYEVEKHHTDKAHSEIMGRIAGMSCIPGYKASLEAATTQEEARPLFGL
jgi:hypothetical protein